MLLGTQMCWWVCVWLIDITKISRWWHCEPPPPGETYLLNECALPSLILIRYFVSSLVPFIGWWWLHSLSCLLQNCGCGDSSVNQDSTRWTWTWWSTCFNLFSPVLFSSTLKQKSDVASCHVEISMIQSLFMYFHCLYCLQFKGEIMKPHSISIQSWYCLDFWKGMKPQRLRLKVHDGILQGCCLHYDPSQHFVELEMELVMLSLNVFHSQKC